MNTYFQIFENPEFVAGTLMSTIILAAMLGSSVFRSLALAGLAGIICWVFFRFGGAAGVIMFFKALKSEFVSRPIFSEGTAFGLVIVLAVGLAFKKRRLS